MDSGFTTTLDPVSLTIIKFSNVIRKAEPDPPYGKYIWLKSFITGKYVTVSGNILYATNESVLDSAQIFFIEDAGNGYIRLKSLSGKGGYVEAQSNSQNYLEADGTGNDSDFWKWKHVYEKGFKYAVLESKIHPDLHARVNDAEPDKPIDALGGTGNWARFRFGLALSDKKEVLETIYGILDSTKKEIAIPDSLYITDFKNGLVISEKATLDIFPSSSPSDLPVSGQDTTYVDSGMFLRVKAKDNSLNWYTLRILNNENLLLKTSVGTVDSTGQLLLLPENINTSTLLAGLTVSPYAIAEIRTSSSSEALIVNDSMIISSYMYLWVTAENGDIKKYAIEVQHKSNQNYILSAEIGVLDSANQTITLNESVLVSDFISGLVISEKAFLEAFQIKNNDTLLIDNHSSIFVTNDMEVWVTAEDFSTRLYNIESTLSIHINDNFNISVFFGFPYDEIRILCEEKIKQVNIYNLQGKILINRQFNELNVYLDVSELNAGMFLLEVISKDGRRKVEKIIIPFDHRRR